MTSIESVSAQPDRAGRYYLKLSDGSTLRLYKQTVQDFGLYAGLELSEERLSALKEAAAAMSAKMRAVRIVTASNVSKKDLKQRLVQKGEDPKQAEAAVSWMEDLNLIDDEKTAQLLVQRCASKGYGIARAKQMLYEKKIPKSLWEDALADYPDQSEHILSFLRSRLGEQWEEKDLKKAIDALLRRGHGYSEIRECLKKLEADAEEFREDYEWQT